MIDLDAIETIAKAATPGPWWASGKTVRVGAGYMGDHPCGSCRPVATVNDPSDDFRKEAGMGSCADDCAHIAAADPQTVLDLIAELRAAR